MPHSPLNATPINRSPGLYLAFIVSGAAIVGPGTKLSALVLAHSALGAASIDRANALNPPFDPPGTPVGAGTTLTATPI